LILLGFPESARDEASQAQRRINAVDVVAQALLPCGLADLQNFACVSRALARMRVHSTNRKGNGSLAGH
jgi:hypothetical protein